MLIKKFCSIFALTALTLAINSCCNLNTYATEKKVNIDLKKTMCEFFDNFKNQKIILDSHNVFFDTNLYKQEASTQTDMPDVDSKINKNSVVTDSFKNKVNSEENEYILNDIFKYAAIVNNVNNVNLNINNSHLDNTDILNNNSKILSNNYDKCNKEQFKAPIPPYILKQKHKKQQNEVKSKTELPSKKPK